MGLLISVIGTLCTIIFGIYSIFSTKSSFLRGFLFLEDECIKLHDGNRKGEVDVTVTCYGQTVEQSLYLFKGAVFNFGSKDIDKSSIEKGIEILIGEGGRWLFADILGNSENLIAKLNCKENRLSVEIRNNVFKPGEYVYFFAIAETPNSKGLELSGKSFDFRIKDVSKTLHKTLDQIKVWPKVMDLAKILLLAMLFFSITNPFRVDVTELEAVYLSQDGEEITLLDGIEYVAKNRERVRSEMAERGVVLTAYVKEKDCEINEIKLKTEEYKKQVTLECSTLDLIKQRDTKEYFNKYDVRLKFRFVSRTKYLFFFLAMIMIFVIILLMVKDLVLFFRIKDPYMAILNAKSRIKKESK